MPSPVIVVLTSEIDGASIEWLSQQLKELERIAGKISVCLEIPENETFENSKKFFQTHLQSAIKNYENYQQFVAQQPTNLNEKQLSALVRQNKQAAAQILSARRIPFFTALINFLTKIEEQNIDYKFVDHADVGKIIKAFDTKTASNTWEKKIMFQDMQEKRENLILQKVTQAIDETNGLVVVVLGNSHGFAFQSLLQTFDLIFVDIIDLQQVKTYAIDKEGLTTLLKNQTQWLKNRLSTQGIYLDLQLDATTNKEEMVKILFKKIEYTLTNCVKQHATNIVTKALKSKLNDEEIKDIFDRQAHRVIQELSSAFINHCTTLPLETKKEDALVETIASSIYFPWKIEKLFCCRNPELRLPIEQFQKNIITILNQDLAEMLTNSTKLKSN